MPARMRLPAICQRMHECDDVIHFLVAEFEIAQFVSIDVLAHLGHRPAALHQRAGFIGEWVFARWFHVARVVEIHHVAQAIKVTVVQIGCSARDVS